MRKIRVLSIWAIVMILLCSCAAKQTPDSQGTEMTQPQPTVTEEAAEPLSYDEILSRAILAYSSFPETGWSTESLNRNWLLYTSELSGDGVYKFHLTRNGYTVDCLIDALSGEVTEKNFLKIPEEPYKPLGEDEAEETAIASALGYFGISESEAEGISVQYDKDVSPDFRHYYVSFTFDGKEYLCDIDPQGDFYTSNIDIGRRGANNIALNDFAEHADNDVMRDDFIMLVVGGEIFDMVSGQNDENGQRSYFADFKVGGYKFNYKISDTGEILDFSMEPVEDWSGATAGGSYSESERLSEHEALKIALEDSGVSVEKLQDSEVVYIDNGGYGFYSVRFSDGDRTYNYDIDVYSGTILRSDK